MKRSTNSAPDSLSTSYLIGSAFIGISTTTLKSSGRLRPAGPRSRLMSLSWQRGREIVASRHQRGTIGEPIFGRSRCAREHASQQPPNAHDSRSQEYGAKKGGHAAASFSSPAQGARRNEPRSLSVNVMSR